MLKKQTVWLLTMLSLMIVLSVYYMSSPNGEDLAFINTEVEDEQAPIAELAEGVSQEEVDGGEPSEAGTEATSSVSTDELFTKIRMEIDSDRSEKKEQLQAIVASTTATTDEKDKAYEEMQKLDSLDTKENILEETLKAEEKYHDVLVRADGEDVIVTVKTDGELSRTETVNIMQMANDEFGEVKVEVKFQPVG